MTSTLDVKMNLGAVMEHSRATGEAMAGAGYRHGQDVDQAKNETIHRQESVSQVAERENASLRGSSNQENRAASTATDPTRGNRVDITA